MSSTKSNTRNTVASAHARLDEFEANLDARFNHLEALIGALAAPVNVVERPAKATKAKASKKGKGKKAQTPAEVKAKSESYSRFSDLRATLKAHKASGAIPSQHNGTFVTVKSAIADGLMNEDGSLPGGKKAKASKPQATAKVAASNVARVVPSRRANGTIAPKPEWAIREALKAQGKTPKQVDKATAKAMKVLNG